MGLDSDNLERLSESGAGYRILIVDDDPAVVRVLTNTLHRRGYETLAASDGDTAWELAAENEIDAIITDIGMPGRSGEELLDLFRDERPSIPVILITGMATLDAAVAAMRCGAFDYIAKPVQPERLLQTVANAIQFRINAPSSRPIPDLTIVGEFRVIRFLGEGSSGLVYIVKRDADPGGPRYAMKLLKLNSLPAADREKTCRRFLHEARAVSTVDHPNVVHFVDYGLTEDNTPYLVMEFFPHPSLANAMPLLASWSYLEKVEVLLQIAKGLRAIHAMGICHRDIKPANVMIDTKQRIVKISDFGIAKIPGTALTASSTILGSPAYMAPEGFETANVDARADIFSMGTLAYELLLGHRPFPAENVPDLMRQIPSMRPVEPLKQDPLFPTDLQLILAKMLQKRPEFRYASGESLCTDLEALLKHRHPPHARPHFWKRLFMPVTSVWS